MLTGIKAQDKKLMRLFNNREYCKCIERCKKNSGKEKYSALTLFIKTSAYFELYKNPDVNCDIKNPLTKCFATLDKLQKKYRQANMAKTDTSFYSDILELEYTIIDKGIKIYSNNIMQTKWDSALQMIELLKPFYNKSNLFIDKAICEYALSKSTALETANLALKLYQNEKQNINNIDFITKANGILQNLDSTMNKDFVPFMDSVFKIFPDNETLANIFYNHCKKNIRKFTKDDEYDFIFSTIEVIFKYYPDRQDWSKEINEIVLSIADSLTQRYIDDEKNYPSLIASCNLLMKTRSTLKLETSDFKKTKFYQLKANKNLHLGVYSKGSTSFEFSFSGYKEECKISIDWVIPQIEMTKIKDFIWTDAPAYKKACNPGDLIKPETFNALLLDTLCHKYCNKFRKEYGKKPLDWYNPMYRASRHHSLTMACRGAIFHGEGNTPLNGPLDSVNYYWKWFGGENCQLNHPSVGKDTYDSFAKELIQGWIDSPGHRANMLDDDYSIESISTTITNYSGEMAAFLDDKMAEKYFPEIKKLFEILPLLKESIISKSPVCFSSQNFKILY